MIRMFEHTPKLMVKFLPGTGDTFLLFFDRYGPLSSYGKEHRNKDLILDSDRMCRK